LGEASSRYEETCTLVTMDPRKPLWEGGDPSMTARRLAIDVLIFVAIIIVITAVAIWLNLGPVASSAR